MSQIIFVNKQIRPGVFVASMLLSASTDYQALCSVNLTGKTQIIKRGFIIGTAEIISEDDIVDVSELNCFALSVDSQTATIDRHVHARLRNVDDIKKDFISLNDNRGHTFWKIC